MSNANEDRAHKILSRVNITTWATTVIALAAVVVSFWTGYETRRHNRLSVKPLLGIAGNTAPGPEYGLILSNDGAGPALVTGWKISYKNELMGEYQEGKQGLDNWNNIEMGWLKIREKLCIRPDLIACGSYNVIRSGQRYPIFWITQTDWNKELSKENRQEFSEALKQIKVEIDYESIYRERNTCVYEMTE